MALTSAVFNNWKPSKRARVSHPVVAGAVIYRGAVVIVGADGYADIGDDAVGAFYAGIALNTVDNSAGSSGDVDIVVDAGGGSVRVLHQFQTGFGTDDIVQSDVGTAVYIVDDNIVDFVAGVSNSILLGTISKIEEGGDDGDAACWVSIKPFGVIS